MSKFCPDISCEFYEDFPVGLKSKKSKACPSCLKLLIIAKPTEVTIDQDDQTLLLTDTPIQPPAGIHSSERSESARLNLIQKSKYDKPQVLTEMDPDETEYCYIDIKTLIWKEYWDKIESVCLRIGLKYFDKFGTSIVPFHEINKVRMNNSDFVVINGVLKYPRFLITRLAKEIQFAYKYYLHLKDGSAVFENLSHINGEYNRFMRIPLDKYNKEELIGKSFYQFDLMVLPEITKKSKGYMSQLFSLLVSDKEPPFLDIAERRLFSLQALLPSYLEFGGLEPCSTMEIFITEFNKRIIELIYFELADINYYHHAPRFWNLHKKDREQNLIKLVESWLMIHVTCDRNKHRNAKLILYRFYLSCYLIYSHKLSSSELNLQLILSIEFCLEDILKEKLPAFGDTLGEDINFVSTVQAAIVSFIFREVMISKSREKTILLFPLYHKIAYLTERSLHLQDQLKYSDNEYWGFPEDCVIYCQEGIAASIIKEAMRFVQYDPILPYSIMIYTMTEKNVKLFIELLLRYPQHIHLSTFMSVVLFRLGKARKQNYDYIIQREHKLWNAVFVSLVAVILKDKDKIAIQDINRLNKLTIFFIKELPIHHVDESLFKLILDLLFNGITAAAHHSPDLLPISLDDSKYAFRTFFRSWIVKNKTTSYSTQIYYQDFEKIIKFLDDILMKYFIPPSLGWFELIEEFLSAQLQGKDLKLQQQYVVDIFILLHDKNEHSQYLQDLFRKEITERIHGVNSGDRQKMIKLLSESLKGSGQLRKVSTIFSKILLDESKDFEKDPLKHFINWSSWGTYFQFLSSAEIRDFISKDAFDMLLFASEQFFSILDLIYHLQSTFRDVNLIRENEKHFIDLVGVILHVKRDSKQNMHYTADDIREKLQFCKDASNWILNQRRLLLTLYQFFGQFKNINLFKNINRFFLSFCH